jgi:hypothetical protein
MFRRKLEKFTDIFFLFGPGSEAAHFKSSAPVHNGPELPTLVPCTYPKWNYSITQRKFRLSHPYIV